MKQAEDAKTVDMIASEWPALPVKRRRGRPAGDKPAMTSAQRMAAKRERERLEGLTTLTVKIPLEVFEALNVFIQFKDSNKDAVVEKLIRSQIMRKR